MTDLLYSTSIYSFPNNLIIFLNRGKNEKSKFKVQFPEQLNLKNFVKLKKYNNFKLYGVISDLGINSMEKIVAYCRNRTDEKWYLYKDGTVTPCNKGEQYNGIVYVLFYRIIK